MGGQVNAGIVVPDTVVKGRVLAAAGLAHPCDLADDAAQLCHMDGADCVKAAAPSTDEPGDIGKVRRIHRIGRHLDLRSAAAGGSDGTGICHGQFIGAGYTQVHHAQGGNQLIDLFDEGGKLVGQHGAGSIAQGNGSSTGLDGGGNSLSKERRITAACIIGYEFHIGADFLAGSHGIGDGGKHRIGLFVEQIFHLHGADRSADLQSGMLCNAQGIPCLLHTFPAQRHRNRHSAALHGHGNGLDPQRIDLGIFNTLQLDHGNTQLIQQLSQLDLFLERQGNLTAALFHGHVADLNVLHSFILLARKCAKIKSPRGHIDLRDEYTSVVPP